MGALVKGPENIFERIKGSMSKVVKSSNFITSICSGLVVQVVSALLLGNWQDFN